MRQCRLALIADREPLRLVQAFARVTDPRMRRTIVSLVEQAAGDASAKAKI